MAPILYKMDPSPPANAARMLADIIGLELELKDVNILAKEHKSAEYLKLNPIGTIPTLKDGDFALSDSHAIMKYLLAQYGGYRKESLYPSESRAQALVDQAMFFNTGVYFTKLKLIALSTLVEGVTGPTDQDRTDIETCYGVLEAYLKKHKYIAANHLTIADLACGATTIGIQTMHKLDAEKFPVTAAWLSGLRQQSSFKKIAIPGADMMDQIIKGLWERNKQN